MIEPAECVNLLRKIYLFRGVTEEQLMLIARMLDEHPAEAGATIIEQGSGGTDMYLVYSGRAQVVRFEKEKHRLLATLVTGDFFGEEELLTGRPRSASITAETATILFVISRQHFSELQRQIPNFKATLQVAMHSHRLARALDFKWRAPDEEIYFVARKHWVRLLQALVTPVLAAALPFFLVAWGLVAGAFWPIFLGGLLSMAALGWMVWNVIDWGNDYYIVTNQRVVWLEKVIGIYDSRQEAPLSTLLSVGIETDLPGRLLDYGNVVVRTFVGQIRFNSVIHPKEASNLISEQWERSKEVTSGEERAAMKEALLDKFREEHGLTVQAALVEAPAAAEYEPASRRSIVFSLAQMLGGNLISSRFEDGGAITYRKHWFVLLKQVSHPTFFIVLVLAWMGYRATSLLASSDSVIRHTDQGRLIPDTLLLSLPFVLFLLAAWWTYQFVDWRNDIFQVTADQILDIDKKPFGTEERRAAPLDNILSTQSSRIGLAGYLLNFGTVYITVGGAHLVFEDVMDPAGVQGDIDRRRATRIAQKKKSEADVQRDRMTDWLISYHENAEALRRQQHASEDEPTRE